MQVAQVRAMQANNSQEVEFDDEEIEPDEQALIDIREGINLFVTVKTLLDYMSNPILSKRVNKTDRTVMASLSEEVRTYLASVVPTYDEEGE